MNIIKIISETIRHYIEFERDLLKIKCVTIDKNNVIDNIIHKIPRKRRTYAINKGYRLAVYGGYSLTDICNELNFYRTIKEL